MARLAQNWLSWKVKWLRATSKIQAYLQRNPTMIDPGPFWWSLVEELLKTRRSGKSLALRDLAVRSLSMPRAFRKAAETLVSSRDLLEKLDGLERYRSIRESVERMAD